MCSCFSSFGSPRGRARTPAYCGLPGRGGGGCGGSGHEPVFDAASWRGRVGGRKRQMTPGKVESARKLLKGGMSPRDVAENLGVSIPTLYRWVPISSQ